MAATKPFLILQLRPEDETSDNELEAFTKFGDINITNIQRVRMERDGLPKIVLDDYAAIIIGGGPYCISDKVKPPEQVLFEQQLQELMEQIIENDFPFLGICYGLSILAQSLGGIVSKERYNETVEATNISLTAAARSNALTAGLPSDFLAFGGHKESCQNVPPGATLLASSKYCPVHMISVKKNIYATQFHPELEKIGLALRINCYRNKGYFPPEDADKLLAAANKANVVIPQQILQRFVERYRRQASQT